MIEVVNVYAQDPVYYVGRPRRGAISPLGNPFDVSIGRTQAVEKYRHWLWGRIKNKDPLVLEALRNIYDYERIHGWVSIGCFCAPALCHGDIIKRALECQEVIFIIDSTRT